MSCGPGVVGTETAPVSTPSSPTTTVTTEAGAIGSEPAPVVGFFTSEQAERGREAFGRVCAECHTTGDFRGAEFERQWQRRSVWNFFSEVSWSMPEDNPGSLPDQTYADVIAYILRLNGYESGPEELTATQQAMQGIRLGPNAARARSSSNHRPQ